MGPSLLTVCTAALALVGDVSATKFYLDETYDKTNFFDKWDFFESDYSNPDYNAVDPTSGYVNYRNRHDAQQLGLIEQVGDDMRIGVNSSVEGVWPGIGRDSVRIESKSLYNQGLMIARFSHLPKPVCGSWPAFWSFGDPWPQMGELDFYEGWNDQTTNTPVVHTNHAAINGSCRISEEGQTSEVTQANCDTYGGIWQHQGCTSRARHADPWGSDQGGIYAVEWTDAAIKFYSWTWENRPDNIDSEEPDTSTWGTPSLLIANSRCNINSHFRNHKLVINITFCGTAAGNGGTWGVSCAAKTGEAVCDNYVAKNPEVFEDTYWQIKDIRHFGLTPPASSTSSSEISSSTETSSSIETSSVEASSSIESVSSSASSTASESSTSDFVFNPTPTFFPPSSSSSASSSTFHFTNSSTTLPPTVTTTATSSSDNGPVTSLSTSTIYTTRVTTITTCPPYIPDCPDRIGQVVTEVIAITTTVCPVVISTKTVKQIHSITSCPPSVPSSECPYGSKTTETFLTTVTKILNIPPKPTSPYGGADNEDDYEGDEDEDEDYGEWTPSVSEGEIVPTTTEYVYHTATVVPIPPSPPVYKPIDKNITVSVPDTKPPKMPVYYDDFEIPETAGATHPSFAAGLTVVLAAAVVFLAL